MKKNLFILVATILAISLSACNEVQNNETVTDVDMQSKTNSIETEKSPKIEKSIDAVAEFLGLTNGSETFYSMIGATNGKEYNDGSVELYQFDKSSEAYKKIIGEESPLKIAAYNDGIVIVFPNGQDHDVTLVEKFNQIKFK